jgi:hypothetical protein
MLQGMHWCLLIGTTAAFLLRSSRAFFSASSISMSAAKLPADAGKNKHHLTMIERFKSPPHSYAAAPTERVVICGGGIIGASIAYQLSLRGYKPVIVERSEIAAAASGKSGGFLGRYVASPTCFV